jgi:RNA polymerase sigma factor (sigma-70 family)
MKDLPSNFGPQLARSKKPDELLPTRSSLLSRLRNWDDQASWQEFFDTYWELIYGVAVKAGLNDAEAQDVVQETILKVAKSIKEFKYDPAGSFKAWLLNTTRWKIADQFRKRLPVRQSRDRPEGDAARTSTVDRIPSPTGYDLGAAWDDEWRSNAQEKALDRVRHTVNPKHYQIFDMYVIRQWPVEKVAQDLRVSEDVVYKAKSRITKLLRREVARLETNGI